MSYEAPAGFTPTAEYCPRHPDRLAYVRCQRCGRPVCPECQVPAAVGVQCVDCVRHEHSASRTVRSALGAPLSQGRPVVTLTLVAICVVVYLGQMADSAITNTYSLVPALVPHHPWIMGTSIFLHANLLHIAFNMWALWSVGSFLENILGRWRFLALFLLSGFGGSVGMLVWAQQAHSVTAYATSAVGASGAIFGLFGAILLVSRKLQQSIGGILGVIAINLVFSFTVAGIAWQAHVGGLVIGLILGALYAYAPRASRMVWSWVGSAVVLVALVIATGYYMNAISAAVTNILRIS